MTETKDHCWSWGRLLLLAVLQATADAYIMVSMSDVCGIPRMPIRLGRSGLYSSATFNFSSTVPLEGPCATTITAVPGFEMSLYVSSTAPSTSTDGSTTPCLLKLSTADRKQVLEADLCGETLPNTQIIFSHKAFLIWNPPPPSLAHRLRAVQVAITAIGAGINVCSSLDFFPCQKRQRSLVRCVARELVCDGVQNCPGSGGDEHPMLCGTGQTMDDPFAAIQKLFSAVRQGNHRTSKALSTTPPTDELENNDNVPDSIPEILAYYSPWGYLMLGMLITGTVLMLCGLWECCCRRPRPPAFLPPRNLTAAAIFAISSDVESSQPPPRSEPPSYEELDQPPAYDSLFPITKLASSSEQVI